MSTFDTSDDNLTRLELAWELVELFGELPVDQINEVLAKNVPIDTLEFFAAYAEDFSKVEGVAEMTAKKLPNLLLLGYLLRVLEERLLDDTGGFDA
jgi:DNA integrity scanning protein DisA with diadenylate cyclase activity